MSAFVSNTFRVETRATSRIVEAATGLAPWTLSPAIELPWLNATTYRVDADYPIDSPDRSRGSQMWFWGSRMIDVPHLRRYMGIFESHTPGDVKWQNPEACCLTVIDEDTGCIVVYEDPLNTRVVFHLMDNNCYDSNRQRLVKMTADPRIAFIDVNAVTLEKESADNGAASLPGVDVPGYVTGTLTGCAMDFFPTLGAQGSYVVFHQDRVIRRDIASAAWSGPTLVPNLDVAVFHNVGHYNPVADMMIFGGGSYDFSGLRSFQFWTMDSSGNIEETDECPVVLSVNSADLSSTDKAVFAPMPNQAKSVALHENGNAYIYDFDAPAGSKWTVRTGAFAGVSPNWVVSIPRHNALMMGDFARQNNVSLSKIYMFRCE